MVAGMVMPLEELWRIYELLFRDGVMVAKKDKRPQSEHPEVRGVTNLQVMRAMGSLKSRGYVKETFTWRHFYWYLTNEGIVFLRDRLRLPPEIVPSTLQRVRRPVASLEVARRSGRVQAAPGGPAFYAPKPSHETREGLLDRQGYRKRLADEEEAETRPGRCPTPADPSKPGASWERGLESQSSWRKGQGRGIRVEAEETQAKRTATVGASRSVTDTRSGKASAGETSAERVVAISKTSQNAAPVRDVGTKTKPPGVAVVTAGLGVATTAAVAMTGSPFPSKAPKGVATPAPEPNAVPHSAEKVKGPRTSVTNEVKAEVPHQKAKSPLPHQKAESPLPPKKAEAPVPHQKAEAPVPHQKAEAPVPPKKAEAPVPPKKAEAPVPHQKAKSLLPPKKAEAPVPHQKAEAPALPKKAESPLPHQKAEAPVPHQKAEAPVPHQKAEAPVPHQKAEAPVPHQKAEAPVPPKKAEAPVPPKKAEAPVPPKKAEAPALPKKAESPLPHQKAEAPVLHQKAEAPVPPKKAESPLPHQKAEAPVPHWKGKALKASEVTRSQEAASEPVVEKTTAKQAASAGVPPIGLRGEAPTLALVETEAQGAFECTVPDKDDCIAQKARPAASSVSAGKGTPTVPTEKVKEKPGREEGPQNPTQTVGPESPVPVAAQNPFTQDNSASLGNVSTEPTAPPPGAAEAPLLATADRPRPRAKGTETAPKASVTAPDPAAVKATVEPPKAQKVSVKKEVQELSTGTTSPKPAAAAAALRSEAPVLTDKGREEPSRFSAEKVKREVPRPPSEAEPRAAAESTTAGGADGNPVAAQIECLTARRDSTALEHRGEKESVSVLQPSSESTQEDASDDSSMRKKIVVVEEVIEVKRTAVPRATREGSAEGTVSDLQPSVTEGSPRVEPKAGVGAVERDREAQRWADEPEEKTWPDFVEGLRNFPLFRFRLPALLL